MPKRNAKKNSNKKSKAARQRNRPINNPKPTLSVKTATIGTVSNSLLRRQNYRMGNNSGPSRLLSPYIHCRTNPFGSPSSAGIPDGSSVRRLVFDHRSRSVVQCNGTGLLDIQFIPAIPCGALYRSASTSTTPQWIVDGSNIIDPNIVTATPAATSLGAIGWQRGNVYPEYNALLLQDPTIDHGKDNPVPASRFRVVSMGWKISYIGQPMQASGYYYATRQPVDLVGSNQLNADVLIIPSAGAVYTQASIPVDNTYMNFVSPTDPANAATQAQVSDRIDVGACGVLRANANPEYKVLPKQNWYLVPQGPSNATNLTSYCTSTPGKDYGGFRFWDDRFDPTTVRIQGMTSGTSLLVETVICVEYEVDTNSILSRIAEPSAPSRPLEVNAVEKVLENMPIAEKLVDIDKPMMTANRIISGALKAGRMMPGPLGTAAATVDNLIDLFGGL